MCRMIYVQSFCTRQLVFHIHLINVKTGKCPASNWVKDAHTAYVTLLNLLYYTNLTRVPCENWSLGCRCTEYWVFSEVGQPLSGSLTFEMNDICIFIDSGFIIEGERIAHNWLFKKGKLFCQRTPPAKESSTKMKTLNLKHNLVIWILWVILFGKKSKTIISKCRSSVNKMLLYIIQPRESYVTNILVGWYNSRYEPQRWICFCINVSLYHFTEHVIKMLLWVI